MLFQGGATFDDDTLMPADAGAAGNPIVFGSYGSGEAKLPLGVWFKEASHFGFEHLAIGPEADFQGTGNDVTIEWCTFENPTGLGINAMGSDWTIDDNTVNDTGNSGMLLEGENYIISGNTISNTGLNNAIAYGKHGIYLKVGNATVSDNTITNFSADGISARHHDSTIVGNYISGGPIGIAWFQMDTVAGTSHWTDNTITDTTEAGIYVSTPDSEAEHTLESFAVEHNTIQPVSGVFMNLEQTLGTYAVQANTLL